MALGSTQPLTEMITRSISWGKGDRCVRLTTYHNPVPLSRNLGTLTSWNPVGHSRPVMRLLYLYLYSHSRRNFLHHAANTQLCGKTSHCKWSKQHSITGTCRWSIHCECTYTSQSAANWVFAVCPHDEAQRNALKLVTGLRNSTVWYSLRVSS
jgi:hypothetical protein